MTEWPPLGHRLSGQMLSRQGEDCMESGKRWLKIYVGDPYNQISAG